MPLSWNEIRQNAIRFSREWEEETREQAEAKSFWDAFFAVFGIPRRSVATFEEPVRNLRGQYGFIDLFWKGRLLVEHKSRGKSLDRAESQAFDYLQSLAAENRHDEIPRYVIVSDFERLALYDLEPEEVRDLPLFCGLHVQRVEIQLKDLHRHVQLFGFIPGYQVRSFAKEDPINIKAAAVMGELHDALAEGGYAGHNLERFLVRVLFCLFAEDTGLFDSAAFTEYLLNQTRPDGSDLGMHLAVVFQALDTPKEARQRDLDDRLLALPYVNGGLFAETLPIARLNSAMRAALVRCTEFDWSRISPAVFGSLFQCVMEPKARRQIGAHYTSERDILKVIRSLFLDDLRAEFETLRRDRRKLVKFHEKLGTLKFFDPACGCGNFLVVTYRELRLLELDVLEELYKGRDREVFWEVSTLSKVDVDQMSGIELEEWPARIAETALWLMDHQMNLMLSERFGQYLARLPLRKTALIVHGNALRLPWKTVLNPAECSYILGNPPFVGKQSQNAEQKADMAAVWGDTKGHGVLDYVTCWYRKAADFIQGTTIRAGFVSTNSITQGEQVGVLWSALFARGIQLTFAHRTFPWQSEARGKAHVHVVIIGFAANFAGTKRIYEESGTATVAVDAKSISPYLVEGGQVLLTNREHPLSNVPEIGMGNQMIDGGHYLFTPLEKAAFLESEPGAARYFRRWLGAEELLNGVQRWCLLLRDCPPDELRRMPQCIRRLEAVTAFRKSSQRDSTRKLAATPTRFQVEIFPSTPYLVIPEVSSERRRYIPMAFLSPGDVVCSNKVRIFPDATLWHFGVLTSAMHMDWMRHVTGRLKSDYQYSVKLVYNNFPWPEDEARRTRHGTGAGESAPAREPPRFYGMRDNEAWAEALRSTDTTPTRTPPRLADPSPRQSAVEEAAHVVLTVRAKYPTATLADLYDPRTMPSELVDAHAALDRAVDRCYRTQPFTSDRQRVEFLFALYERLANPLLPGEAKKKRGTIRAGASRER